MKKYIVAAALMVLSVAVFAEKPIVLNKEVVCLKTTSMFAAVRNMYGEYPVWHGNTESESSVVITANTATTTWSIIHYNETVACLLETGSGFLAIDAKKIKPL